MENNINPHNPHGSSNYGEEPTAEAYEILHYMMRLLPLDAVCDIVTLEGCEFCVEGGMDRTLNESTFAEMGHYVAKCLSETGRRPSKADLCTYMESEVGDAAVSERAADSMMRRFSTAKGAVILSVEVEGVEVFSANLSSGVNTTEWAWTTPPEGHCYVEKTCVEKVLPVLRRHFVLEDLSDL
jgi:hypothetical protein